MRKLLARFRAWRKAKVRAISWGPKPHRPYHITFTPHFGCSFPWFKQQRIRIARHHGIQAVKWRDNRWMVSRQIRGTSKVRGERFLKKD